MDFYAWANIAAPTLVVLTSEFYPKFRFRAANMAFLDTILLQLQAVDTTGGLGEFQIEVREVLFEYERLLGTLPTLDELRTFHATRLLKTIPVLKGGTLVFLTDALAVHIGQELVSDRYYDIILRPLPPTNVGAADFYNLVPNTTNNSPRADIHTFYTYDGGVMWNKPVAGVLPLPIVLEGYNKIGMTVSMDPTGYLHTNRAPRLYTRAVAQQLAGAGRDICSWKYVGDCDKKTFTVVENNTGPITALQVFGCIVQDNGDPRIYPIGAAVAQAQNSVRAYTTEVAAQYMKVQATGTGQAYAHLEAW